MPKLDYTTLAFVRHSLAGKTMNLKNTSDKIKTILESKFPDILSTKLSDDHLYTLGDYLNMLEKDSNTIQTFIKDITEHEGKDVE